MNQGVTLTFDLQNLTRSPLRVLSLQKLNSKLKQEKVADRNYANNDVLVSTQKLTNEKTRPTDTLSRTHKLSAF